MAATQRRITGWMREHSAIGYWLSAMLKLGGVATLLSMAFLWFTTPLPTPDHLRAQAALGDTRILDRNGRLIASMPDPLGQSRNPVPLSQIPLALRQATVAVEDAGFYTNPGIDLRGIARALWQNATSGEIVAGGSTITQQLARNVLLDPALGRQQSLERKLREIVLAFKLTLSYPKDEILALYLNQTYYGGASYGVEAASWRLFGKPVHELDLAESALIAGLPQAPSQLDPLADGGAAARVRQLQVLEAMQRAGFLTATQVESASSEPLEYAAGTCRPGTCEYPAPHFVAYVLNQLAATFGSETLARGGLTITTTLDLGLQDAAQAILKRQIEVLATPRDGGPNRNAHNGAVIVLDPSDGAVLAMVGSPDFSNRASQGQVNAVTALRQPGSALKPLTYAAALEQGFTPASILLDVPTSFPTREGQPYIPQNYDRRFHGPLSLREALATSSNISAVRTLRAIGIPALLNMASRLGIHSLGENPSRFGLALTLGGGEVSLLELTGAYAGLAHAGERVVPYAIIDVTGQGLGNQEDTETRRQGDKETQKLRSALSAPTLQHSNTPMLQCFNASMLSCSALSPQIAYLITDILADPYARMRAFGTALDIGRPAAVKTGTSTDWRDNWTVGYTPDRVVGVWVGNADGSPMEAVSGVTGAGPVWRAVMREAHRGLPARSFVQPAGIVTATICADSGMLPSPNCPATREELFVTGTQPRKRDNTHVAVRIGLSGDCRVLPGLPAQPSTLRVFRILPPEAQPWASDAGVPLVPRRVCTQSVAQGAQPTPSDADVKTYSQVPAIVAPASGTRFAINPGISRERQQLEIIARDSIHTERLAILIDGKPIATINGPPYRAFWKLEPGQHTISVESHDAQGQVVVGEVVSVVVDDLTR